VERPGLATINFDNFQVGYVGGKMSKSGKVGFVGGQRIKPNVDPVIPRDRWHGPLPISCWDGQ
jgi:hypothetical protein